MRDSYSTRGDSRTAKTLSAPPVIACLDRSHHAERVLTHAAVLQVDHDPLGDLQAQQRGGAALTPLGAGQDQGPGGRGGVIGLLFVVRHRALR